MTPADKLPITKITRPSGFDAEVWVPGSLDTRDLRQGDKGTIFASSAFVAVAGKMYTVVDTGGKREGNSVALE